MKILLLSHNFTPFIGGIEVMSEMLCNSFVKAGHEVRVMTWTPGSDDKLKPYKVIRMPNKMRLLNEHKWADLVFENNPSLRLSWPRIFIKRPSVVALQTWIARMDGQIAFQDRIKKYWINRSSHVIACSNALREGSHPTATVIGNPYRSDIFKVMPEVIRDKDFVFLGRLVSDKGAIMAIQALDYFINRRVTYKNTTLPVLTIIGDAVS
jgi:glycosyltransferase involved in cell wall biosynthesis